MIESNIIGWLDFGDSTQNIDIYSKKLLIIFFRFLRILNKDKSIPIIIYKFFMIISFIQILELSIIFVPKKGDIILEILDYLENIFLFYKVINKANYIIIIIVLFCIILFDYIIMIAVLYLNKKYNLSFLILMVNLLNLIIYYYLIGPLIAISLMSLTCQNKINESLSILCFSNSKHLYFLIFYFIILLLYIIMSFLYSLYFTNVGLITNDIRNNLNRTICKYEIILLIIKIIIFIFSFLIIKNEKKFVYEILYESFLILVGLIMSIYSYKNVYYYNNYINFINHIGWYIICWFNICIYFNMFYYVYI